MIVYKYKAFYKSHIPHVGATHTTKIAARADNKTPQLTPDNIAFLKSLGFQVLKK